MNKVKMKKLSIDISEEKFRKYGLKSEDMNFSELRDMLSREIKKQRMEDAIEQSEKCGLS